MVFQSFLVKSHNVLRQDFPIFFYVIKICLWYTTHYTRRRFLSVINITIISSEKGRIPNGSKFVSGFLVLSDNLQFSLSQLLMS